jgi:hypothetical protein
MGGSLSSRAAAVFFAGCWLWCFGSAGTFWFLILMTDLKTFWSGLLPRAFFLLGVEFFSFGFAGVYFFAVEVPWRPFGGASLSILTISSSCA